MQPNTRQFRANTGNRIALGVLIVLVSLFSFLADVHALGGVGRMVYSFTVGFFGLADYAYSIAGIVIGLAVIFNLRVRLPLRKIATYSGLFVLAVLALHIYTSSVHIVNASYGEYLLLCYNNTNTAGGMLFGIASYPIMKAITTVGALILVVAVFFILAFFAIFPYLKKNTVFSAPGKKERDKSKPSSTGGTKITSQKTPAITDFNADQSEGKQNLYVVNVSGDPLSQKTDKKLKGADGYNPLYPNAAGRVEDEFSSPTFDDKFEKREIARRILFRDTLKSEDLERFNIANNPDNALKTPGAPYSAVRAQAMRRKLMPDKGTDFVGDYSVPRKTLDSDLGLPSSETVEDRDESYPFGGYDNRFADKKTADQPDMEELRSKGTTASEEGSKVSFEQLKADQIKIFGRKALEEGEYRPTPLFVAEAYDNKQTPNPEQGEIIKPEVVKPSKFAQKPEFSTSPTKTSSATEIGLHGEIKRRITGEEPPAPAKMKDEIVTDAYKKPQAASNSEPKKETTVVSDTPDWKRILGVKEETFNTHLNNPQSKSVEERTSEPNGSTPYNYTLEQKPQEQKQDDSQSSKVQSLIERAVAQKPEQSTQNIHGIVAEEQKSKPLSNDGAVYQSSIFANTEAKAIADARAAAEAGKKAPPLSETEKSAIMRERASQPVRRVTFTRDNSDRLDKLAEKKALQMEHIDTTKERVVQVSIEQSIAREIAKETKKRPYNAPPMDLLLPPTLETQDVEDWEKKKDDLLFVLESFGISGQVLEIKKGPTFSLYTLSVVLPKGKTVGSIVALEKDIAMKMEEDSVRILAPIPGRNAIGIEVPNKHRRIVRLSEIIDAPKFNKATAPATFALGKDLYNQDYVCNIKDLPHMLIAGATGAGKSCCINSLIISLLYKASPDDVRLILVDPKRVELSVYEGIPHLMLDEIICDVDKAIRALNWAITEMNRRILFLSEQKYRDIDEYNSNCEKDGFEKMPRIVIIVDELADLMAMGKKAVEDSINRLARLARAVGIHLILATQRPSVDVVSGTIKNNLPTRVAFKVTSGPDSRTILDSYGADKLLGNGDLLYTTPKSATPVRMQGAYISESEVKAVVAYIKKNNDAFFDSTVKDAIFNAQEEKETDESKAEKRKQKGLPPELFDALRIGMEESFTVSSLQRKLGLGWQKAARIGDLMKEMGVLLPDEKDPKRSRVNLTEQEFEELLRENEEEN